MSVLQSEGVIPPSHICKGGKMALDVVEDASWMFGNANGWLVIFFVCQQIL